MRCFTPQLFIRFNAADHAEADQADDAWEEALAAYRKHLGAIPDRLPSQVRKPAGFNLHDAQWVAYEPAFPFATEPSGPFPFWSAMAILSLRQDQTILSLIDLLGDRVRENAAPKDWPFYDRFTHWLYDEVDVDPAHPARFIHRILWSDGRSIEVPFMSVVTHTVPLTSNEREASRQIA